MAALRSMLVWSTLGLLTACDPSVVDAVREPAVTPRPVPNSPQPSALIHRYSFNGTGTAIEDSKGAAHGKVIGAELPGYGALPLSGGDNGPYVDLPNKLIRGLSDATFEAWVTWTRRSPWQRIFDFGNGEKGEDGTTGAGVSYLFLTASSGVSPERNLLTAGLRAAYAQEGVDDENPCQAPAELPVGVRTHVALVVDEVNQTMTLYQNGQAVIEPCDLPRPLSAIDDVNNWLGRSNYADDAEFSGIFDEFRIYSAALTPEEIFDSERAGPDAGLR